MSEEINFYKENLNIAYLNNFHDSLKQRQRFLRKDKKCKMPKFIKIKRLLKIYFRKDIFSKV